MATATNPTTLVFLYYGQSLDMPSCYDVFTCSFDLGDDARQYLIPRKNLKKALDVYEAKLRAEGYDVVRSIVK